MNPSPIDCCQILPWDSEFFGLPIARLTADRLTPELAGAVDAWCHTRGIRCLYFLASSEDSQTGEIAESHGYHLADIRMTFECQPLAHTGTPTGRLALPEDLEGLCALARANSGDSRFAFDKGFPEDASARLYYRWMERSCLGEMASAVFVLGNPGIPLGYVTCELDQEGDGKIGLLGLAPEARGRGLAQGLLAQAIAWFQSKECQRVSVITQGRNLPAQRLYQRAGFLTSDVQLWYHKWFPTSL